jgi:hypothetical protein
LLRRTLVDLKQRRDEARKKEEFYKEIERQAKDRKTILKEKDEHVEKKASEQNK